MVGGTTLEQSGSYEESYGGLVAYWTDERASTKPWNTLISPHGNYDYLLIEKRGYSGCNWLTVSMCHP